VLFGRSGSRSRGGVVGLARPGAPARSGARRAGVVLARVAGERVVVGRRGLDRLAFAGAHAFGDVLGLLAFGPLAFGPNRLALRRVFPLLAFLAVIPVGVVGGGGLTLFAARALVVLLAAAV